MATEQAIREAVLTANAAFYEAFAARDLGSLRDLLAVEAPVACTHPGWSALVGRDAVLASWEDILHGPGAPRIEVRNPRAQLLGGDAAFVICTEIVSGTLVTATNVFATERGEWRMVHHHASPILQPGTARRLGSD